MILHTQWPWTSIWNLEISKFYLRGLCSFNVLAPSHSVYSQSPCSLYTVGWALLTQTKMCGTNYNKLQWCHHIKYVVANPSSFSVQSACNKGLQFLHSQCWCEHCQPWVSVRLIVLCFITNPVIERTELKRWQNSPKVHFSGLSVASERCKLLGIKSVSGPSG